MSRTKRYDPRRDLEIDDGDPNWIRYRKEDKEARRKRNRSVRHANREVVKQDDPENEPMPVYKGTCGWETW